MNLKHIEAFRAVMVSGSMTAACSRSVIPSALRFSASASRARA